MMSKTKPRVRLIDLGKVDYQQAWDIQTKQHQNLVLRKRMNQGRVEINDEIMQAENTLFFCEHNPVYTLGKSGTEDHLLLDNQNLEKSEFQFFKINRGGDITYHGPGQLTVYPIFDLEEWYTDVHRYVRELEEVIIRLLAKFDIVGSRQQGFTGVWISDNHGSSRKICAIGVHMSRWVTLHGLAFNINTDLGHFENIIPCGIQQEDKTVTSLSKELSVIQDFEAIKLLVKQSFAEVFDFEYY